MRLPLALLIALAALVSPRGRAAAQTVVSPAPVSVAVTAYRDPYATRGPEWFSDADQDGDGELSGLAMVTETRLVDLPAGASVVQFRGVANGMIPQSARLDGLNAPVIEQNFDYNLLSPARLIESLMGQPVTLVSTNPVTGRTREARGRLRSGPKGVVVDFGDHTEAFHCGDQFQKLVFDHLPPDLQDRPVLSVTVGAPQARRYRLTLSYLVLGVSWAANYVAALSADGQSLDLTGALTLRNAGDVAFRDAAVQVVAGRWNKVEDDGQPVSPMAPRVETVCWASSSSTVRWGKPVVRPVQAVSNGEGGESDELVVTGARIPTRRDLADYKLFALAERTTLAARQTKQLTLLEQRGVTLQRVYRLKVDAEMDEDKDLVPEVVLKLSNDKAAGLGEPLPAGTVTILQPATTGGLVLAGVDRVRDVPVGRKFSLALGAATGVWARGRTMDEQDEAGRPTRRTLQLDVFNSKPQAVAVELLPDFYGFKLASSNQRLSGPEDDRAWRFTLPAGAKRTLRFVVVETND